MILRLSQKLATRLKIAVPRSLAKGDNPLADWSVSLFTADCTQYVLLTNTVSLYSAVLYAQGFSNDNQFLQRVFNGLAEQLTGDGQESIYLRSIAPTTASIRFSKPLNRSVTASLNDLITRAKAWLAEGELSPYDVAAQLNDIPLASLGYRTPREVFKELVGRK